MTRLRMTFQDFVSQRTALLNDYLVQLSKSENFPGRLGESMAYSLLAGGKRFRALLVMATYESSGGTELQSIIPVAAAVECVHTYSLIHDDLPAMDDDELRRGQLTNHKKFDEATAILAGDGLLTYAFELLSLCPYSEATRTALVYELAHGVGPAGMVHGQMLDMQSEDTEISLDQVRAIHTAKTGALIRASVRMGALAAGANEQVLQSLTQYAQHLGVLFQITDDIMNVTSTAEILGKGVGTDAKNHKSTYVTIAGLDQARILARQEYEATINALPQDTLRNTHLQQCAEFIINRIS